MSQGTPSAERPVDGTLVRALLRDQHPDLADETLIRIDAGWDNHVYRLGAALAVRLPRRAQAVPLIEHEQKWLPVLAERLPLPIPVPVRVGRENADFPWPWSILPWLTGDTANRAAPAAGQARPWAQFLRALHLPAPPDAPRNAVRGVPLQTRAAAVEERLHRLRRVSTSITPVHFHLWQQALAAPEATESCWLHGDLHGRNVLVNGGAITGVIDWGDLTAGDAATDLASIWTLFDDAGARMEGVAHYAPAESLLRRARGWALLFGAVLLDSGLVDHPPHAAMGEAILRRLAEDT